MFRLRKVAPMYRAPLFALLLMTSCHRRADGTTDASGSSDAQLVDSFIADASQFVCGAGALCETFESSPAGAIANGANLGMFTSDVSGSGTLAADTSRAFRGSNSLKVHIDGNQRGGGRIFSKPDVALFASKPRHIYGRFMAWFDSNASSIHWTLAGASGKVAAPAATAGNDATYLFSVNSDDKFSAVYYNNQTTQDCWHHSTQQLPLRRWVCVGFEADGESIRYRLKLDGAAVPSFDVNTTGDGCLAVPGNTPWSGPMFSNFYVGAMSFHPMSGPLDVWIDDVIVDTSAPSCP
jgi:hypothetical protein